VGTEARDPITEVRPGDRWLVVVAHPDDETFGCGSLIVHGARGGADITVTCATRGEEGERTDQIPPDADLGTVREEELRTAAAILGVREVVVLDHRDSGFDGPLPVGALCASPRAVLADLVVDQVGRLDPVVVVVIDARDGHRDHEHVRLAVHEALARPGVAPQATFVEVALSNRLMRRWAAETEESDPGSPYLRIDPDRLGTPDELITDWLDVSHLLDVRLAAIAAHRSQDSPFEDLSPALRRDLLAETALIRVARPERPPARR
jgi:N-acetyl-1-D-myo-inositol-2-amino-2-deoxy-alpha-D-glucopyranoside deacetylase